MSEELQDEVCAIEAIYPECIEELGPQIYKFKVPQHEYITLQMSFPDKYPQEKPCILDVVSDKASGNGGNSSSSSSSDKYLMDLFTEVLDSLYQEGMVVVFDLFTELDGILGEEAEEEGDVGDVEEHWNTEDTKGHEDEVVPEMEDLSIQDPVVDSEAAIEPVNYQYDEAAEKARARAKAKDSGAKDKSKSKTASKSKPSGDPLAGWSISEPIVDRKSTFVGFAKRVNSVAEANRAIEGLMEDRKIAKANHVMRAYRILDPDSDVQWEDCDDDGEAAAGSRMLHLLNIMDAENVIAVVARWFGGVHIGPDRFRHINSAAREAIVKGHLIDEAPKKKKKGKKH